MTSEVQMIVGLIIAIVFFVFMLTKTKIHVFMALLMTGIIAGLIGGVDPELVISAIQSGFGNTLGNLGILIVLGIMLGKMLEISGATEVIANTMVDLCGEGREHIAMILTGFVTSLAIFCVPGMVILFPIAKTISANRKISIASLGVAIAGGLFLSHTFVPPASGPIGTAGIFGASITDMMLWGFVISIPVGIFFVFYTKWLAKKFPRYILPEELDEQLTKEEDLPSALFAYLPILMPVLLIVAGTLIEINVTTTNTFTNIMMFLSKPIIALGVGVLLSIFLLTPKIERSVVLQGFEDAIASGAKILLMVGAGGALGNVVNESGVGTFIAESLAKTPIPALLLPLIIATILRVIQGSGSVASLTAASISAPIMATLGISPVLGALAAATGSVFFSYFNDAYFWTINESIGEENVKNQMINWSVPTTIDRKSVV